MTARPTLHLVIPGHPPRMPHPVVAAIARDTAPRVRAHLERKRQAEDQEREARSVRRLMVGPRTMAGHLAAVVLGLSFATRDGFVALSAVACAALVFVVLRALEAPGAEPEGRVVQGRR